MTILKTLVNQLKRSTRLTCDTHGGIDDSWPHAAQGHGDGGNEEGFGKHRAVTDIYSTHNQGHDWQPGQGGDRFEGLDQWVECAIDRCAQSTQNTNWNCDE